MRAETFNMNTWLEYFLGGLAKEYERVAGRIAELQALGLGSSARIELNASQERGRLQLNLHSLVEFRRVDYERLAEISRSTASRALRNLEEKRLIVRRGKGSASAQSEIRLVQRLYIARGDGEQRHWVTEKC